MPIAIIINDVVEMVTYASTLKKAKLDYPDALVIEDDNAIVGQTHANGVLSDPVQALSEQARLANASIDARSQELIRAGASFDGQIFSLSDKAQTNWTGLFSALNGRLITLPHAVSTIDDQEYIVTDVAFFGAMLATVSSVLASGRALKTEINASTDPSGIRDNR